MTCMNDLIERYNEEFKAFLYRVAHDDQADHDGGAWAEFKHADTQPVSLADVEEKHLLMLHGLLVQFKGRLLEALNEAVMKAHAAGEVRDFLEEEEMFEILDLLPEPKVGRSRSRSPNARTSL